MKKMIALVALSVVLLSTMSCARPDYKKVTEDFIKKRGVLREYTITAVEDTESRDWKAVVVYEKRGRARMPVVFLVSRDGTSVVPMAMVYVNAKPVFTKRFQPEFGRIDFPLTEKDRIVYNPSGKKTVYMFSDPDCPYCKRARENLKNYRGEYRVVVKHFPLARIHPDAPRKAVAEQAEWLRNNRKDITRETERQREAQRMVDEDMAEAQRAEIQGVPTYVMEDGSLRQGLF